MNTTFDQARAVPFAVARFRRRNVAGCRRAGRPRAHRRMRRMSQPNSKSRGAFTRISRASGATSAPLLDPAREQDGFDQLWARITADATTAAPATAIVGRTGVAADRDWRPPCCSRAGYVVVRRAERAAIPDAGGSDVARLRRSARSIRQPDAAGRRSRAARGRRRADRRRPGCARASIRCARADPAESLRQLRALPDVTVAEPADC